MKIRVRLYSILDEYVFKIIFVIVGLLYWTYGFTARLNLILNVLLILTLLPGFFNVISKKIDYRILFGILTLLLGMFTVIFCNEKNSTFLTLLRPVDKLLVLGYCNSKKDKNVLEEEIKKLYRIIVIIGTIILLSSLMTYFAGLSVPYYINSSAASEESTILYLGRYGGRDALCGVLANPNMASNFSIIYLGSLLCLIELSKRNILSIILLLLDLLMLFLTRSRGGLVGAIIVLGIYFWYLFKDTMSHSRMSRRVRYIIIFFIVSSLLLFLLLGGTINIFSILNRSQTNMSDNTQVRFVLWLTSLQATFSNIKNVIIGIGHDISSTMRQFCPISLPARLYTNVHNSYLQMALEFGIPSALMMVCFFIMVIKSAFTYLSDLKNNNLHIAVLFGLVSALLVTNLVESDMLGRAMEGTFVWIFSGYLYCLTK